MVPGVRVQRALEQLLWGREGGLPGEPPTTPPLVTQPESKMGRARCEYEAELHTSVTQKSYSLTTKAQIKARRAGPCSNWAVGKIL